ncbi:DMT family transporter [Paraglaciecola sp. L3A3]|uniref:DMT family transporter n=1 Tax=Paraglaciecola sp. L3A3 TaxID=2686358 RepID=UPI00131A9800|nr:DMT family transporter [Paraglaciecola sp. L3A3]
MNTLLYLATVMLWGTTWIAIHWQVGDVTALVSVFYRFAIAGALFLPILFLLGKLQKTDKRDHCFFLLQGACLFSLNFVCFYTASQYIISGLISVIFALATIFNALNQWLIWRDKPTVTIYLAGLLGLSGLVLLFWQQLSVATSIQDLIYGIGFSVAGTYCFSLGNMISVRHSKNGIKPWTSNAYGMIYGVAILLLCIGLSGTQWQWDNRPLYLASLIYLAIPGSIIGFTVYLALVARIGANQAAYTTVLFPIVALTISIFVEGYTLDITAVLGLILVITGVLVSSRGSQLLAWLRGRRAAA